MKTSQYVLSSVVGVIAFAAVAYLWHNVAFAQFYMGQSTLNFFGDRIFLMASSLVTGFGMTYFILRGHDSRRAQRDGILTGGIFGLVSTLPATLMNRALITGWTDMLVVMDGLFGACAGIVAGYCAVFAYHRLAGKGKGKSARHLRRAA